MNRREIRELVLQALYAYEVGKNSREEVLNHILKQRLDSDKEALKFAESMVLRTLDMEEELDEIINQQIKNWEIHRLAVIDKLILRLALCEFLRYEEIPTKVTINEAIELAKNFSTQKSGKFVNGILDAALQMLKSEGRIKKSGRGLIETTRK